MAEMTKCGGKRGRGNKQLKCPTAAQGDFQAAVAIVISRLNYCPPDWFEGRRDYVRQILLDKFPLVTDGS